MSLQPKITKEMLPALQGVVPSTLATSAKDGTPNVTYVSQVFYVDEQHVALSFQFLNKTWRNLQENPVARAIITRPGNFFMWKLKLRYLETQTEGPVFDQMDMQMMAMVSTMKVKVDFQIKAALICRVEAIDVLYDGQPNLS